MPILTRTPGETILIGDNVKLTILTIKGGQARIGIDAPKDIPILRDDSIKRESKDE